MLAHTLAAALFSLPLVAEAQPSSLRFGPSGTYSDARVHVFIDADQPPPRCACFRFSFAVDDAQSGEIRDDKVVLWAIEAQAPNETRGSHVLDLVPVYRHPESPTRTTQALFRIPYSTLNGGSDMQFHFMTMRKKCRDTANPQCREYVPSVQGTFKGRQLVELSATRIGDLFEE
jgi:hypothetical protein